MGKGQRSVGIDKRSFRLFTMEQYGKSENILMFYDLINSLKT